MRRNWINFAAPALTTTTTPTTVSAHSDQGGFFSDGMMNNATGVIVHEVQFDRSGSSDAEITILFIFVLLITFGVAYGLYRLWTKKRLSWTLESPANSRDRPSHHNNNDLLAMNDFEDRTQERDRIDRYNPPFAFGMRSEGSIGRMIRSTTTKSSSQLSNSQLRNNSGQMDRDSDTGYNSVPPKEIGMNERYNLSSGIRSESASNGQLSFSMRNLFSEPIQSEPVQDFGRIVRNNLVNQASANDLTSHSSYALRNMFNAPIEIETQSSILSSASAYGPRPDHLNTSLSSRGMNNNKCEEWTEK